MCAAVVAVLANCDCDTFLVAGPPLVNRLSWPAVCAGLLRHGDRVHALVSPGLRGAALSPVPSAGCRALSFPSLDGTVTVLGLETQASLLRWANDAAFPEEVLGGRAGQPVCLVLSATVDMHKCDPLPLPSPPPRLTRSRTHAHAHARPPLAAMIMAALRACARLLSLALSLPS